jgi:phenylalanyl-tRNA synthetase beta chain
VRPPPLLVRHKHSLTILISPHPLFFLWTFFFIFLFPFADPTFFPGRAATIYYRARPTETLASASHKANPNPTRTAFEPSGASGVQKDVPIGRLGILHPSVLEKFEIGYPCSALEFSLEPFKGNVPTMWTNDDI